MNPDIILVRVDDFHDPVGEGFISRHVGSPLGPVESGVLTRAHRKKIMKQRPEIMFTESMVEVIIDVGRQECRETVELLEEVGSDVVLFGDVDVGAFEGADVDDVDVGVEAVFELEDEAVVVELERPCFRVLYEGGLDREVVRNDDTFWPGSGGGNDVVGWWGDDSGEGHEFRDPVDGPEVVEGEEV